MILEYIDKKLKNVIIKDIRMIKTIPLENINPNITDEEYNEVCNVLEEKLSWGSCGWCE